MSGLSLRVLPCPTGTREAALHVLYQRIPESLRGSLVAGVLQEEARGQIDLSGLWIAQQGSRGGKVVGALLTQALAGRAAAVWAPEVRPSWRRGTTAASLVRGALESLCASRFRLAQAVLDESASRHSGGDLIRGGMPRITELLYTERDTQVPLPVHPRREGSTGRPIEWVAYNSELDAEFRAILEATYVDSLDMPELNGVRSVDDVLESHRATGRFVADRWRIGRVAGEPASACVLLLTEVPGRDAWEVVYLGLTPPARSRGLGWATIAHALELARPHASRLELAVDIRNHPAARLYESAGFVPFDRRSVHLVVFPEADGKPILP